MPLQSYCQQSFSQILDNHGHPSYTCLHRVMVHGSANAGLEEKEMVHTRLEEKEVIDTEKEEVVRMVDSNPLGNWDNQQSEL